MLGCTLETAFLLSMNCHIINACMRLLNFIVHYQCNNTCGVDAVDMDIFNDDAQRYLAVHPNEEQRVFGGEADVHRSGNGNIVSKLPDINKSELKRHR